MFFHVKIIPEIIFFLRLELNGHRRRLTWEATPRSIHEGVSSAIMNSDCLVFDTTIAQLFADNGNLGINVTISMCWFHFKIAQDHHHFNLPTMRCIEYFLSVLLLLFLPSIGELNTSCCMNYYFALSGRSSTPNKFNFEISILEGHFSCYAVLALDWWLIVRHISYLIG